LASGCGCNLTSDTNTNTNSLSIVLKQRHVGVRLAMGAIAARIDGPPEAVRRWAQQGELDCGKQASPQDQGARSHRSAEA
jgi:hypothetical protein